jgi:hypothetical protein
MILDGKKIEKLRYIGILVFYIDLLVIKNLNKGIVVLFRLFVQ